MTCKQTFRKINHSNSFEQCADDVLKLAEAAGMKDTISAVLATATTDYEVGMAVAKVFDTYGVVPEMKWLPAEIKALYVSA